jgi:hypothetical protein
MMHSSYELVDLRSGNMIEDYDHERDAIETLVRVAEVHGIEAIATFALAHMQGSKRRLVAMQDELVSRVEQEMGLVSQHRSS